jgi:hypothetical protein
MATHRFVTGGFYAECTDCPAGHHLYRHDHADYGITWTCTNPAHPGRPGYLADRDVYLEHNEEHEGRTDETGRVALYVVTFDEYDDDDEPEHVNYPHEPGRLYDCPACESRCHCTPGTAECVYDGPHAGEESAR